MERIDLKDFDGNEVHNSEDGVHLSSPSFSGEDSCSLDERLFRIEKKMMENQNDLYTVLQLNHKALMRMFEKDNGKRKNESFFRALRMGIIILSVLLGTFFVIKFIFISSLSEGRKGMSLSSYEVVTKDGSFTFDDSVLNVTGGRLEVIGYDDEGNVVSMKVFKEEEVEAVSEKLGRMKKR